METFMASEICPHAIKVTQANFPKTIQLGDVREVTTEKLGGQIDLLLGGSPVVRDLFGDDIVGIRVVPRGFNKGGIRYLDGESSHTHDIFIP